MHRNTYLLIAFLAVFAALVIGVNITRHIFPQSQTNEVSNSTVASPKPESPTANLTPYTNAICGISLSYPQSLTKLENASGSALFVDSKDSKQSMAVTCQKNIPRPSLPDNKIESRYVVNTMKTASISAKLYHDASPKDGSPIDALIFKNPSNGLDVFVSGYGNGFDQTLSTLQFLP